MFMRFENEIHVSKVEMLENVGREDMGREAITTKNCGKY